MTWQGLAAGSCLQDKLVATPIPWIAICGEDAYRQKKIVVRTRSDKKKDKKRDKKIAN